MMNRIEIKVAAGLMAAAIGFAPLAYAAAADTGNKAPRSKAKSPAAGAPSIARIVVRPSGEQLAKIRAERRLATLENRAGLSAQAASGRIATTGAL